MTAKLEKIILVDDSSADNYYHQMIIEKARICKTVTSYTLAAEALNTIGSAIKLKQRLPELIFLDLNMPAINGWEFLDRYEGIVPQDLRQPVIIILSTSVNPSDHERAESHPAVSAYCSKPLNADKLQDIVEQYFS
ncbi:MAG: response regulator [Zhongshania sp.]|uniref:response regulator n=1 Tax=Zhongshania sp. TaxID=1971902 RepID=UPI0026356798|nr:response regulator [Zhongshania sp.]MDF1692165.1 response regulator [Zhongshania sp.]